MTTEVVTARPDTPFKDLVALLSARAISAVPVVADDGTLLGVVSEADLLGKQEFRPGSAPPGPFAGRGRRQRWARSRGEIAYTVMTHTVLTARPDEPVGAAAARLAYAGVRRLFVVDPQGRLLGVLARRDLLGVFLRADHEILADVERTALARVRWADPKLCRATVRDGVVILIGSVATRAERELAGRLAAEVTGVVAVHNTLDYAVDGAPTIPD
jgi:CBS domain-containing protein